MKTQRHKVLCFLFSLGGDRVKKMILTSIAIALTVVLSTMSIPIGAAKVFPFQHMMNVILAIIVGTRYNVSAAFCTSVLRNLLALGSPLAFPGSMVGAALSGYLYSKTGKIYMAAIGEVIGTGIIGALLSYPVALFLMGKELAILTLMISFTMSSVAGAIIGYIVSYILNRSKAFSMN